VSRGRKIAAIVGGSVLGLILLLLIAAVIIVHTGWFRNYVREKIIASIEQATGGRAEVGSFSLDLSHLRAVVNNLVIHGKEGPNAAPLFRARRIEVDLSLFSHGLAGISHLVVNQPQANVIVYANGATNLPTPKSKSSGNTNGLQTMVNLAIGRFDLNNGSVNFAERKTKFDASGENLHALLQYDQTNPGYTGEFDMSPLYLKTGANRAVDVNVRIPVTMHANSITVSNARFTTPQSNVVISASIKDLANPVTQASVQARLALDEVKRAAGLSTPLNTNAGPQYLTANITATKANDRIQIQNAHLALGDSTIEASGPLESPNGSGSLQFNTTLALGQLGKLFEVSAKPQGTLKVAGNASLSPNGQYNVTANVAARNVSLQEGTTKLTNVSLDSSLSATPNQIALGGIHLDAMGGSFVGSATVQNLDQFHLNGKLQHFDIDKLVRAVSPQHLGYDGLVSGPVEAQGSIKNPSDTVAHANLSIAPGRQGIPISGQLNAEYNGRGNQVVLQPSHLTLPHTNLNISGSLGQQIQLHMVSHNLRDFLPVAKLPVTLRRNGVAELNATLSGSLKAPHIAGQATVTHFDVSGRPFDRFNAQIAASPSGATISNATLTRGPLTANVSADIGLHHWKPEPAEPLRADATVRNADLSDILALAGESNLNARGAFTGDVHIRGTLGSPVGNASFDVANGSIDGEHFDNLVARVNMTDRDINIPTLQLTSGPARITLTADYRHPLNDLKRGSLTAHVGSTQVQLAQFQTLVKSRPGLSGTASVNGDFAANLYPSPTGEQFQIVNVSANAAIHNLQLQGQRYGNLTATADTRGADVYYNVNSDFAGSSIRVNGETALGGNHDTTATAQVANLKITPVLDLTGESNLPVTGTLSANAQVSGTLADPHVNATFDVTHGSAYQEPISQLQATLEYSDQVVAVQNLRLVSPAGSLQMTASLSHPAGNYHAGQARFQVRSSDIHLADIHVLQQKEPGLAGTLTLDASGDATLRATGAPLFHTLNANFAARGLVANNAPLGDLTASVATHGNQAQFQLASDIAQSDIHANGTVLLTAGYPVGAQLRFAHVTYSGLEPLLGSGRKPLQAEVDGYANISGPLEQASALNGSLVLTKLSAQAAPNVTGAKPRVNFAIQNQGNLTIALNHSKVTIQNFNLTSPYAKFALAGSATLTSPTALDVRANADINLEALEAFSSQIFSAGQVQLNATVAGPLNKPDINGRLQLAKASFNMMSMPNGISDANGTILFNGTEAVVQDITGRTGGGKVTLAGFMSYGGPEAQFRLQATANHIHIEYPPTVTTEASARITLAGATSHSLLSGNVQIEDVALHSHTDLSNLLTSAATPPPVSTPSSGILGGMRFDVRIRTAPGIQFRTTLTQNLQADADLSLRGTPDSPGMLGLVTVTEGNVVFAGYTYTINVGSINFYDPNKINPVVNLALQTTVQGIDVTISLTGPMDRLKLAYRSDPPLQFSQIVSLLAAGKAPTTDPVLAAHEPQQQPQSFQQAGASALLGQAVANPVTGRLQRLFGVSRLQINPQLVGDAGTTAQATLTLQQHINRDLTFTYIQDVTQTNPQIIMVEWNINPHWSAIAQRDQYGMFDLDFFYKKRFH
jgi:translocation and assembly module TamB